MQPGIRGPKLSARTIAIASAGIALLGAAPAPPPGGWRTPEDYPAAALAAGRHGSAMLAIDISTTGRVEDCRILRSTGTELLDQASCKMVSNRARYEISHDAKGQPKRLGTTITVHWVFLGMTQSDADLPIGPRDVVVTANPHYTPPPPDEKEGGNAAERLPFDPPKYPKKALKEDRQGKTYVFLTINARGRVEGCSLIRTSGSADLDQATCDFARRSLRYIPARDSSGRGRPANDTFHINWTIGPP